MAARRLPISQSGDFSNAYISYGSISDLDGASAATFSAWIYQTSLVTGTIFENRSVASSTAWLISTNSTGKIIFEIYTGLANDRVSVSNHITTGTWHHVCIVYNAGTVTMYVDGTSVPHSGPHGTIPTTIPAVDVLTVGSTALSLVARLSNVCYWAGLAASASQVAEIYESGRVHDLAFMATTPTPTRWAILDGGPDLVDGTTGTSAGTFAYISSTPPLVPESSTLSNATTSGGGWGSDGAGTVPFGSEDATALAVGTPTEADWCATAKGWLLSQFYGKPRIEALLCALMAPVQVLEQALADLRDLRNLNSATGAALDVLGYAMGLPRAECPDPDMSDDAYRNALRGMSIARTSNSSPNDMIKVALELLSGAGGVTYTEAYPAEVQIESLSRLSYNEGTLFARIIRAAKPAAVAFSLKYMPATPPGVSILVYDDDPVLPHLSIPEAGATEPLLPEEDSGV